MTPERSPLAAPEAGPTLVRGGYEAFGDGDLAAAVGFLSEEITWVVPGHNKTSGTYRGVAEVLGLLERIVALTSGSFRVEVLDVLSGDGVVAALVTVTAGREGEDYTYRAIHLWWVVEDKAVRFEEYLDDQAVVDELFC